MRFVKHSMTLTGTGRLAGVAAVLLAPLTFAQTTQRPISDFLETQGTFCIPNGSGGCFLFVPPVPNFVGWGDQAGSLAVSVDYAGFNHASCATVRLDSIWTIAAPQALNGTRKHRRFNVKSNGCGLSGYAFIFGTLQCIRVIG
jgi:hypothetical protein